MCIAPFDMSFERAVTGFTTNGHFRHRRVVAVRGDVVIFMQSGVMTFSAEGIPVHAPTSPMAVFTGVTEIVAIDVKPLI